MESRKTFRPWKPETYAQQALTPAEVLPEDDLVFFLIELIPQLDLTPFYAYYERETRGAPPFEVAMMATLLVYSYCVGVFSSRRIAAACERNLAFLAIVGTQRPDFRTISDFRKIHHQRFQDLFVEVLRVAGALGMVKLGNLAVDGSKFRANASRHKAMSYGYMKKEVERLRAEVAALLQQADQTDAEQDAALGSRRGDELPAELKRRQERLQAIDAAMRRLEQEAKAAAEVQRRERAEAHAQRQASGKKAGGRPPKPISETPHERAQTNFTDATSRIMKVSNKGFDYCFNAQAMVDQAHQIIVAAETSDAANDKEQAVPWAEATLANLEAAGIERPPIAVATSAASPDPQPVAPWAEATLAEGEAAGIERPHEEPPSPTANPTAAVAPRIPLSGDNGYFSEDQVRGLEALGFDPHIATGRQKHNSSQPSEAVGPPPAGATVKERMAHKLRTRAGRACYALRKQIVEPVFGQIKQGRGFRQFLLRGLPKVQGEWNLVCLTHNLLKIWRYQCART
jgi:transposase